MDKSPLSQNQCTLASTDVGSPSPSDFGAARSHCSKLRDDVSTLPSGDAEPRESSSTDNELCEERHESEQASSFSCSARSYPRTPASQKPDILQRHVPAQTEIRRRSTRERRTMVTVSLE